MTTTNDSFDFFARGSSVGARAAKFVNIGDTHSGVVVEEPYEQAVTNLCTKQPELDDDGRPKTQLIIIIATDEQDDVDDDGRRALYVKTGLLIGFVRGARIAGVKGISIGDEVTATFTGLRDMRGGKSPMKEFRVVINPVGGVDLDAAEA